MHALFRLKYLPDLAPRATACNNSFVYSASSPATILEAISERQWADVVVNRKRIVEMLLVHTVLGVDLKCFDLQRRQ